MFKQTTQQQQQKIKETTGFFSIIDLQFELNFTYLISSYF
jgi:hypothetical protein